MLQDDILTNKKIGENGASEIICHRQKKSVKVLTHCNTGSLATAGYGTALGVIRSRVWQKIFSLNSCKLLEYLNKFLDTFTKKPFFKHWFAHFSKREIWNTVFARKQGHIIRDRDWRRLNWYFLNLFYKTILYAPYTIMPPFYDCSKWNKKSVSIGPNLGR